MLQELTWPEALVTAVLSVMMAGVADGCITAWELYQIGSLHSVNTTSPHPRPSHFKQLQYPAVCLMMDLSTGQVM